MADTQFVDLAGFTPVGASKPKTAEAPRYARRSDGVQAG